MPCVSASFEVRFVFQFKEVNNLKERRETAMSYQILIVDDDQEFREELAEALSHYKIIQASHGEEALRLIKKPHTIDLVILDVFLSSTNGITILNEIKKIAPQIGTIILTGQSSKEVAIEALRGRADDYIEKPFEMNRLEESIQKVLNTEEVKAITGNGQVGKIEKAKRFVERNYDKKVNLTDVASELCLSPKYLSRIFKESTGLSFSDYKLRIKTQKAAECLKQTNYTVCEIADKFGYKNLESFIRLFKKNMGLTPTVYRQLQKVKNQKT